MMATIGAYISGVSTLAHHITNHPRHAYRGECMTSLIEKLESFRQQLIGFEMFGIASSLQDLIDEAKREVQEPVFDLVKGLNYMADLGFWPQVVYDDNGNWSIQDEGSSNSRIDDEQDLHISILVPAESFRPTIKEAWQEYMRKLEGYGNDLDFNCAFTHPPLSDETVKDAAIGKLVREKMKSGNCVPVSRCVITKDEFDELQK